MLQHCRQYSLTCVPPPNHSMLFSRPRPQTHSRPAHFCPSFAASLDHATGPPDIHAATPVSGDISPSYDRDILEYPWRLYIGCIPWRRLRCSQDALADHGSRPGSLTASQRSDKSIVIASAHTQLAPAASRRHACVHTPVVPPASPTWARCVRVYVAVDSDEILFWCLSSSVCSFVTASLTSSL